MIYYFIPIFRFIFHKLITKSAEFSISKLKATNILLYFVTIRVVYIGLPERLSKRHNNTGQ